ncbi:hypothetical protein BAUCODRAFT_150771 [Baudoinia panamericana UAMH 10762]|uniref:Uncharacterized protein n=1 Tax=Baudoinia panamericana (strain UAMH 10762) TaxID=717646 RepID=M2LH38_BAUPA|nr:uncharacterized protein BAUCODRAFT_150771 [Baudoinia panamericana UAMH 10762]EMC93442.1 hypothetical protein BAUCODRAFT_150771 [Baudoinia panamericana UAMH 10762]
MDSAQDGPQASTRHAKDRRPSHIPAKLPPPSYNSKTAGAIASLEHRLAALESKRSSTSQEAHQRHSNAAQVVDDDLKEFGREYEDLDARIETLESAGFSAFKTDVEARLALMEQRMKPYEVYQQELLGANAQLLKLQETLRTASPPKSNSPPSKLLKDYDSILRELSARLLAVESPVEIAKADVMSTRDLALALTQRLRRGDLLDAKVALELKQVLESNRSTLSGLSLLPKPALRQQDTPSTEESDPERRNTVEQSIEQTEKRPTEKRQRKSTTSPDKPAKARRKHISESATTPQIEEALSDSKSGALSGGQQDNGSNTPVDTSSVEVSPEVRRTGRKLVPTKHKNMVHWCDANKTVGSLRPSVPAALR